MTQRSDRTARTSPDSLQEGVFEQNKKKSTLRVVLSTTLKISVTGGILFYLYQKGMLDFTRVRSVLKEPTIFFTVLLLAGFNTFLGVARWRILLESQGIHVKFFECLRLTMVGLFFNTALPGAVSGDVVKGYYVVRSQPKGSWRIRAFTTLLLDRILGLSGLIFVSFTAMLLNLSSVLETPSLKPLSGFITALWVGMALFFAFVLINTPLSRVVQRVLRKLPLGHLFARLFDAVKTYEKCRGRLLGGLGISILIHCISVTSIWILAQSLGGFESLRFSQMVFLVPIGLLVTAIPIAPAGLGTGHYAFYFLLGLVGPKNGADLYTAWVAFQLILSMIGGLFYIRYREKKVAHPVHS